mmetsp:Transcript_14238/g.40642  ORF Transcript_14238/g.40642 Transcript_14238/m.40642 type:complete len:206 (-) Transcript_14238:523-1140(-)
MKRSATFLSLNRTDGICSRVTCILFSSAILSMSAMDVIDDPRGEMPSSVGTITSGHWLHLPGGSRLPATERSTWVWGLCVAIGLHSYIPACSGTGTTDVSRIFNATRSSVICRWFRSLRMAVMQLWDETESPPPPSRFATPSSQCDTRPSTPSSCSLQYPITTQLMIERPRLFITCTRAIFSTVLHSASGARSMTPLAPRRSTEC